MLVFPVGVARARAGLEVIAVGAIRVGGVLQIRIVAAIGEQDAVGLGSVDQDPVLEGEPFAADVLEGDRVAVVQAVVVAVRDKEEAEQLRAVGNVGGADLQQLVARGVRVVLENPAADRIPGRVGEIEADRVVEVGARQDVRDVDGEARARRDLEEKVVRIGARARGAGFEAVLADQHRHVVVDEDLEVAVRRIAVGILGREIELERDVVFVVAVRMVELVEQLETERTRAVVEQLDLENEAAVGRLTDQLRTGVLENEVDDVALRRERAHDAADVHRVVREGDATVRAERVPARGRRPGRSRRRPIE